MTDSGGDRRPSYLAVTRENLPEALQSRAGSAERRLPWQFGRGGIEIGRIPSGIPVNLLANLDPLSESADPAKRLAHDKEVLDFVIRARSDLQALPRAASDDEVKKVFANLIEPLLKLSKCPDF